ncbi:helix-turn-helix domain-containing protein [Pedobacter antarcticus]|uniref:response regulator transcription factor n=1 Tax=Pedobacter antarcticus TaxID=34086 RepID=UPI002930EE45|nr:helix-turn-helix domain-containing protein [Pedobacter antarcticus]
MNFIDHKQVLPPGLMDGSIEFFIYEHEVKCLYNGRVLSFNEFPEEILQIIDSDMAANPKAMKALFDWDITDPDEQMRQYIACRFGGFDNSPDINAEGIIQPAEYVDCGRRGNCAYEGKLCSSIILKNGILTKREIDVLREIGRGFLDKEICDKLNISQDTLRSHKDSICCKADVQRKAGLSQLAYKYKLI